VTKLKLTSASSFGTIMDCQFMFDQSVEWPDSSSYAARGGTASHSVCEYETMAQREPGNALEWRLRMSNIAADNKITPRQVEASRNHLKVYRRWLEVHGGADQSWWCEVQLGWNPTTGQVYCGKPEGHRDYSWAGPGWLVGTTDLLVVKPGELLWVADHKFGRMWVNAPRDNWQMKGLAVLASKVFGASEVKASIIRYSETDYYESPDTFDEFDLAVYEADLTAMSAKVMAGKYEPATGEHCKKCPGKTSCQFGIQYIEATKTKREEEAA
jgi:hypothetical protein